MHGMERVSVRNLHYCEGFALIFDFFMHRNGFSIQISGHIYHKPRKKRVFFKHRTLDSVLPRGKSANQKLIQDPITHLRWNVFRK